MIDNDEREIFVPVYCSPDTLAKVDEIVSLWPRTDSVPRELSNDLQKEIGENDAIHLTRKWREELNHPRLPKDSLLDRALGRFNETIGVPLFEGGNLAHRRYRSCRR